MRVRVRVWLWFWLRTRLSRLMLAVRVCCVVAVVVQAWALGELGTSRASSAGLCGPGHGTWDMNGNEMGDGFVMGGGKVASKRQRWLLASEVPSGSRCIGVVGPVLRSVRLSAPGLSWARNPKFPGSACGRRAGIRNKDKAGFPWPALIILDIMCRLT